MTKLMDIAGATLALDATEDRDIVLVRSFQGGDKESFDEILRRYESYVYNVAMQMLGNRADAEDAAQDVLIRIFRSLPGFKMRCKLSTWIYRMTINQCIDYTRSRRRDILADCDLRESPCHLDAVQQRWEVRLMLQKVPPHYRAVLVLRYYQQLGYAEIAEILGWSPAKVKCYLQRGRNIIRQIYEQHERVEEAGEML